MGAGQKMKIIGKDHNPVKDLVVSNIHMYVCTAFFETIMYCLFEMVST